jgi:lipoate-protein ligase A
MIQASYPERPAFDTALSRALLHQVARGECAETLRLHRTGNVMAFSVLDRTRPGFPKAVQAARDAGFAPILRLAGGRAAPFSAGTLAVAWSRPVADLRSGVRERFEEIADIVTCALRALGVDARVGEVPGEYCPGGFSVNAGGRTKLAGVGQRVVRGAAHVGGVVVASGSAPLRRALEPVYRALDYAMDPAAVGSVRDELGEGEWLDRVEAALLDELSRRFAIRPDRPDAAAVAHAEALAPEHELGGPEAA